MALTEVLLFLATICGILYFWCKRNYNYWTQNGVPQSEPTPFLGNTKEFLMLKTSFGLHLSNIYADKRFANDPVVGIHILNKPGLIIRDLELMKSILIKDFNKFSNRFSTVDPHHDSLDSNMLFFVKNPLWKEMRTKLTPVFTSAKVKQMYPLMLEIATELENYLAKYTPDSKQNFIEEIKEMCARYSTDLIASIAFGIHVHSLQNPEAKFRRICREMLKFDIMRAKDFFVIFFLPKLVSMLRVKVFTKEFIALARGTINHVMDEREKTGNNRNDLIDILVGLKKSGACESKQDLLSAKDNDFLVAQGAIFHLAGFETSSATMAFALYELAKHPDLQERLREEICDALVRDNGFISYETINALEYLGMVVNEILRMYPTLPFLDREHITFEGDEAFSLKPHYDCVLPQGMPVYIPIYGIHRDPQYWPDPDTFDPERFSSENKKHHHPMSYLPFGNGPHNCIGMRFGLLQAKLGLVHFFKNHRVSTCEKTPKEIKFDPKAFVLQNVGGLYLNITNDQMFNQCAALLKYIRRLSLK